MIKISSRVEYTERLAGDGGSWKRHALSADVRWVVAVEIECGDFDPAMSERAQAWCRDNCSGHWDWRWDKYTTLSFVFELERDATLYALFHETIVGDAA